MKKQNKVGYEAFAAWEVHMAQRKAYGLVGKYGLTREDIPDLEQELLLEIYLKRGASETWRSITASEKTVTSRILDNRIRDIIDAIKTDKRFINHHTESLSKEIATVDDGTLTYEDILGDDAALSRKGKRPVSHEEELRLVLSMKLGVLSSSQKKICSLLMQGFNVSEIAKSLGIRRSALYREIERMRQLFYENGLHDYL